MITQLLNRYASCGIILTMLSLSLTGCSTGTLRDVTSETASTSTDIIYQEVLSNIAMARFYKGAKVLPSSYDIVGGQIAVNDSIGITTGVTYASITHLFTPSVSLPATRAFQKTWNVTTQDNVQCLKDLADKYHSYAFDKPNAQYFHSDVIIKPDSIAGKYRGDTVWVDADDTDAMNALYSLTTDVLDTIQKYDKLDAAAKGGKAGPSPTEPAAHFTN